MEALRMKLSQSNQLYQECDQQRKILIEPTLTYEKKRWKIRSTIQNMWDFFLAKFVIIKEKHPETSTLINDLNTTMYEYKISLINDWLQMTKNDGYEEWRIKEFEDLTRLVQEKFKIAQNPNNCDGALLVTNHDIRACGWGCQYLHYPDNFEVALVLNRTLVYKKPKSHFYENDEFEKYCQPLTTSCNFTFTDKEVVNWPTSNTTKIIKIEAPRDIPRVNKYLPTNIPSSIYARLEKLSEDPEAWWLGQIFRFLTKLRPEYQKRAKDIATRLGIQSPTIAIHIRRGDKIEEIGYQPVEAYMEHVKEFYDIMELSQSISTKRVLVITDDPKTVEELKGKYTDYEFLFNADLSADAKNEGHNRSAFPIYMDIQLVSICDGLVGTFSSNLGRRFYDAWQWYHRDTKTFTKSLDYHYYEWRENPITFKVIMDHNAGNFYLSAGDIVHYIGHWDLGGQYYVFSEKTNKIGNAPKFKLERIFSVVDIPVFNS